MNTGTTNTVGPHGIHGAGRAVKQAPPLTKGLCLLIKEIWYRSDPRYVGATLEARLRVKSLPTEPRHVGQA